MLSNTRLPLNPTLRVLSYNTQSPLSTNKRIETGIGVERFLVLFSHI